MPYSCRQPMGEGTCITGYLSSGKQGPAGDERMSRLVQELVTRLPVPEGERDNALGFLKKHKQAAHRAAQALVNPGAAQLAIGAKVKLLASTLGPLGNLTLPPPGFGDCARATAGGGGA